MIPEKAFRLGEAAIRRGWCTLAEVVECLAAIRAAVARGEIPPHLEDLLVARGVLTDERAAALMAELRLESTGELVAGYRILARLGSGGMGTVYRAIQGGMEREVALKVLPVGEGEREGDGERFLREARAVARLQHPHIVRGIDAGEQGEVRYLSMELLEGETGLQALRRDGPFGERRAHEVVCAVASALDLAWRHGIIHRDVKPSNVFLCADGRPVLFDFGLAKHAVDDPFSSEGMVALATPHYASPEQIRRLPDLDVRTDLYSLGCTWYHLLTGRVPFAASSSAEIAARHLTDPFPDPGAAPGSSETLRATGAILRRLGAKRREERYPDPGALLADLDELGRGIARGEGGGGPGLRSLLERLVRRAPPAPSAVPAGYGGVQDLLKRIEELQEENARLFCERDLMRHEMLQDEKAIEHLEAENARLACSRDLLQIEAVALRGAMDGLRLRREAQRRARAAGASAPPPEGVKRAPGGGGAGLD